ncbi:MAG: Uma2 family endonuclease [Cyanobacteria bacterium SID2]|nr:Uma2 family endonuclease [Cyanobacteria bacterium SID2]MBP0004862.1 Uma2 family endonuclease [Cyanobacteria bacterium SBC]
MVVAAESELLSFEEYCQLGDSDCRYELFNGALRLMNPPSVDRFFIAKFLEQLFEVEIQRVQRPWTCFQGVGVRTGVRKSRIPDLSVVSLDSALELWGKSAVFETPPFLVVEIVSPNSATDDYHAKRSEYGSIEIPEYWIVDPSETTVMVLLLEQGFYEEAVYKGDESISSVMFPELNMTANQILTVGGRFQQ